MEQNERTRKITEEGKGENEKAKSREKGKGDGAERRIREGNTKKRDYRMKSRGGDENEEGRKSLTEDTFEWI